MHYSDNNLVSTCPFLNYFGFKARFFFKHVQSKQKLSFNILNLKQDLRLVWKHLDWKEDFSANTLDLKYDLCCFILHSKQHFSPNILDLKQDFGPNILDSKQYSDIFRKTPGAFKYRWTGALLCLPLFFSGLICIF